jgi:hypothetical protein
MVSSVTISQLAKYRGFPRSCNWTKAKSDTAHAQSFDVACTRDRFSRCKNLEKPCTCICSYVANAPTILGHFHILLVSIIFICAAMSAERTNSTIEKVTHLTSVT